jgi:hypothetical protein
MTKRSLFFLCLCFIVSSSAFAQAGKTITNADLEKYRQKRLQAEREYIENYEKLGFPSPEELSEQRAEREAENEEAILRRREERLETAGDFKAQAKALRTEIISVEAQINYVRSQFAANQSAFTGCVTRSGQTSIWRGDMTGRIFYGGSGLSYGRYGYGNFGRYSPYGNRVGRGLGNRNGLSIRLGAGNTRWRGYPGYNQSKKYGYYGYNRYPNYGYYPYAAGGNDYSAEDDLTVQLRDLEQRRAGLYAEWQILAEEARRAGVKID